MDTPRAQGNLLSHKRTRRCGDKGGQVGVKRPYVVSKGVAADLRDITKYTVEKWGEAQCRVYIAELEKAAEAMAKSDGVFKDMRALLPGLRMAVCGRHCVFCNQQQGAALSPC